MLPPDRRPAKCFTILHPGRRRGASKSFDNGQDTDKAQKWIADTGPYHFAVTSRLARAKAWPNIAPQDLAKMFAGGRPMIPNAHKMFNFDLGETADAIR